MNKHFYTLLLALLPAAVVAQSQFTRPDRSFLRPESAENIVVSTAQARPTATKRVARVSTVYNWDNSTGKWSQTGVTTTTTYNNTTGLIDQVVTVDSATNRPISRSHYTRNASGYVTASLSENWVGSQWQSTSRYTASYNSNNQETSYLSQVWLNGAWINEGQEKFVYDTHNNITDELYQGWENNAWVTGYHGKYTYSYAQSGVITEKYSDVTNSNSPTAELDRTFYTYPNATSKYYTGVIHQPWVNGAYINEAKVDLTRDSENRVVENLQYNYLMSDGTWQPYTKSTYTYFGDFGYETVLEDFRNHTWIKIYRYTISYDSYNRLIENSAASWKNNAWVTTRGYKSNLSYTTNGEVKSLVYQRFESAVGGFVNKTKTTYKDYATIALAIRGAQQRNELLQLVPNPTSGQVVLKLTGLAMRALVTGQVLNNLGQEVQSFQLSPQQAAQGHALDVSRLKPGVYSLRLLTSEGPVTQRFVRE